MGAADMLPPHMTRIGSQLMRYNQTKWSDDLSADQYVMHKTTAKLQISIWSSIVTSEELTGSDIIT